MDIVKFESIMQRYFEKALVLLLKKGAAYEAKDDLPSYLLVDKKRAVYYAAESDIYDETKSFPELDTLANAIPDGYGLRKDALYAIARLIHSYSTMPQEFAVSEIDLSQLNKLAALIVSNENSEQIKLYLTSKDIDTQNVALKGGFLLIFFDDKATQKLMLLSESEHNTSAEIEDDEPETRRIITPDSISEIIPGKTDIDDELDIKGTLEELRIDNLDSGTKVDPNDLDLSSFDLDSMKDIMEDKTKTAENAAQYEQTTSSLPESASGVSVDEPVTTMMVDENDDLLEYVADKNETVPATETATSKTDGAASEVDTDIHQLEDVEYIEEDDDEDANNNKTSAKKQRHLFTNLLALIFITPAYLLNKITLGKLPGFVIYWFTMLAIFFGIYEIPTSHVIEYYYAIGSKLINENIIQMTDISAIIVTSLSFTQSIEPKTAAELISNPLISSVGFIASVSTFLSQYELSEVIGNTLILKYALTFAVFLMLSPALRATGIRLYSSFMMLAFTIPFILLGQSYMLAMLAENISYLIANPMANPPSGLFMLQSLFAMMTVFVLPIIIFLIYFTFFGAVIRSRNAKGVLP